VVAPALENNHIEYEVQGLDPASKSGKFAIRRRFRDFYALRQCFSNRYPGLYVPPISKKKIVGNTSMKTWQERSFLLNIFIKQLTRCPYLIEAEEFGYFINPS